MQHLLLYTRYLHAILRSCPWARHAAPSAVYQVLACKYEELSMSQACSTKQVPEYKYEELSMSKAFSTFCCKTGTSLKANIGSSPCARHAAPYAVQYIYQAPGCKLWGADHEQTDTPFFCFIGTASAECSTCRCVKLHEYKCEELFFHDSGMMGANGIHRLTKRKKTIIIWHSVCIADGSWYHMWHSVHTTSRPPDARVSISSFADFLHRIVLADFLLYLFLF